MTQRKLKADVDAKLTLAQDLLSALNNPLGSM